MITQFFWHPYILIYCVTVVYKNMVDAKRGGNAAEGATNTKTFFHKRILQSIADGCIRIRVRHIIEITTNYYRVGALIDFVFHMRRLYTAL